MNPLRASTSSLGRAAAGLLLAAGVAAQSPGRPAFFRPPTLYAVASAHLDSQWHWAYPETIRRHLPRTLKQNFTLLRKYPHYVFNFGGASRYRWVREYFPRAYAALKRQVAAGRWFPSGSCWEECDVNLAAPESIVRQILHANRFFRGELGRGSSEFMLPDGFGFPASLPTVLSHCGIRGFSTQKLYRGSSAAAGGPASPKRTPPGIPFNVGVWRGVDGSGVIAALNPGKYNTEIWHDLSRRPQATPLPSGWRAHAEDWPARVMRNGLNGGLFADYMYYGTGDRGGAPRESSVALLEAIVAGAPAAMPAPPRRLRLAGAPPAGQVPVGNGPLRVVSATAERLFLDIQPGQEARLPRYRGELQLTRHSCGTLTSQAAIKRWNRRGEVLADAAERAAVAAEWLAARPYPQLQLQQGWRLLLGAQFHDILAGTCKPQALEYSWNDQLLALNLFADALTGACSALAAGLDTRVAGVPVVVFNPLQIEREDVVEAAVRFPAGPASAVRVFAPGGREVPAQLTAGGRVLFTARVPGVGLAVYDVRSVQAPAPGFSSELRASERALENRRYRVRLDGNGDVAGIFDKRLGRELLAAAAGLEIKADQPQAYPAWNMEWQDQARPPRLRLGAPARVRVAESGPARVALEIERRGEGSRFVQTVRLAAGSAGEQIEFAHDVDWRGRAAHLKAVLPLAAAAATATYNLDVGVIERPVNTPRMFEVASQRWFDQTATDGSFGVTVLSGDKYGSDKPDERTLRLTLLRTPGPRPGYEDQASQDWGRHEFVFGLAAHDGDWRRGGTDWQAYRLDQPLLAFQARPHAGRLGGSVSFLRLGAGRVRLLALKKAEAGGGIVVRLVESGGRGAAAVRLAFAAPVVSAREVDGQERPLGKALVRNGELVADFAPWQLRAFLITLGPPPAARRPPGSVSVKLEFDTPVLGRDGERSAAGFDARGRRYPAELFPQRLAYRGARFELAAAADPRGQAVSCRGQEIPLPPGRFARLLLLAAADGEQRAAFVLDGKPVELTVQDWGGFVGQWQRRLWREGAGGGPAQCVGIEPGFRKAAAVAWFAGHRHLADGTNEPYAYAYLFAHELRLPARARILRLPDNPKVRVFAVTAAEDDAALHPLWADAAASPPAD